jgi:hypothetical protein
LKVTTTAGPAAASFAPSYAGTEPLPWTFAPPWMKTSTGSALAPSGAQTFSVTQSSLPVNAPPPTIVGPEVAACGQTGPNAVASRSADTQDAGAGGRQRSSPTGGAA